MPKQDITLNLEPAKRKRNPPKTAYTKEHPSPYAFKPGEPSANPGGKPKHHKLLSRTARADVARRAPNEVARALGLPMGASWGQCLIRQLIRMGVRGDLGAMRLLFEYVEGLPSQKLALGIDADTGEDGEGGPTLVVNFTSSPAVLEAQYEHHPNRFDRPRLPDPAANAAEEQEEQGAAAHAENPAPSPASVEETSSSQASVEPSPSSSPVASQVSLPGRPSPWLGPPHSWRG